jgi:ubiquinone biosynthesis protein
MRRHLRQREPPPPRPPVLSVVLPRLVRVLLAAFRLQATLAFGGLRRDVGYAWKAKQVKRFLNSLGGIYFKIGQFLAVRTDLFPWEFCSEMAAFLDRNQPFPSDQAVAIVERELARPVDEVFSSFELEPVAAASLGQVHTAVLRREGVKVAVKVRRPGIERVLGADVAILRGLARFLDVTRWFPQLHIGEIVQQIDLILEEELSYLAEARAGLDFRRSLRKRKGIDAPKVYSDYTTERILVMELIEGIPLIELIAAIESGDQETLRRYEEQGIRRRRIAKRFYLENLQQTFEHDVIHSDPHPANIFIQGRKIYLIDFGAVAYLDPAFRRRYERLLLAFASHDSEEMVRAHLDLGTPLPPGNIDAFSSRLQQIYARQIAEAHSRYVHPRDRSGERYQAEVARLQSLYGFPASWQLLRLARANLMTNAVVLSLDPHFDFDRRMRQYFKGRMRRMQKRGIDAATVGRTAYSYLEMLGRLPRDYAALRDGLQRSLRKDELIFTRTLSMGATVWRVFLQHLRPASYLVAVGLVAVRLWRGHVELPLPGPWWAWVLGLLYLGHLGWWLQTALNRFTRDE